MTLYDRRKAQAKHKADYKKYRDDVFIDQFKKTIYTRCQTIFVGAVASIERSFGCIWDDENIDEDKMSIQQKAWYEKFLDVREEIFDRGHEQITKLLSEFDSFLKTRGL